MWLVGVAVFAGLLVLAVRLGLDAWLHEVEDDPLAEDPEVTP
jgi:hypothetical protein